MSDVTDGGDEASLSVAEIARLIAVVLHTTPRPSVVEALQRRGRGDPTSVVHLVRCLLSEEPAALDRLAFAATRETNGTDRVFRRDGDFWTITYGGHTARCRHAKGLSYLALLLGQPGEWIDAADIRGRAGGCAKVVTGEQARISVTKAVRASLGRLAQVHPDVGRHLEATVRTGKRCAYIPDPEHPVRWST